MTPSALAETPATDIDATWWRQAIVYQVYPRSFADSNGDGLGDIRGIVEKVDYLADLGVDAVWLSPFYPSELADGGYDVADYRDVDPRLGTLDDFDDMVAALHARGIKVIVDIVPNHSSDKHDLFQAALAAPKGSPERDRYIFRDGKGENGELPPADWTSVFGGPAWEPVGDGQWYFHYFATEQPDFNWKNQDVRAEFLTTLRFWSDRGVDGFRIDVAHGLSKDLPEVLPTQLELDKLDRTTGLHPLWDRDEVQEIYAEWRHLFDQYSPPRIAVAEAWVASAERRARYARPEGLGQAFNFDLLVADFDAEQFRTIVSDNLAESRATGSSSTWVLSNHDVVRHATRYGLEPLNGRDVKQGSAWILAGAPADQLDRERGLRRARAATLFLLGLPGSSYLYQGEELGLHEVGDIADEDRQDPAFFRGADPDRDGLGRDGCRVPLPWTAEGESFGFGADGAHIPQPDWFASYAVDVEEADPGSTLTLYRRALRLRRQLQTEEVLEWTETGRDDVLRFTRPNGWQVVTNFGTEPFPVGADADAVVLGALEDGAVPAETTVWLKA